MIEVLRQTRESWLEQAIEMLRPRFTEVGLPLPKQVRVSVGFAYGARPENRQMLGQCWARDASDDGINHVFISAELNDTFDVLETLIHQLIHAADDCASGHKGEFVKAAIRLGLRAPMTFTPSSPEVEAELALIEIELGKYPHGALHPAKGPTKHSGPAKQNTRMIKVTCPTCGYTVRLTRRWLDHGAPICPVDSIYLEES